MRHRRAQSVSVTSRPRLDLSLFDAARLGNDEIALEVAVSVLDGHLGDSAVSVEDLVTDLSSIPHLLEFVLSVGSQNTFETISQEIINQFPTTATAFLASVACSLLSRFSLSLLFATFPSSADEPADLREHKRYIDLAVPVLTDLVAFSFADECADNIEQPLPEDENDIFVIRAVKVTQRSKKKAKLSKRTQRHSLDAKVFDNLGVSVPQSQEDADNLVIEVLTRQKSILEYYFDIFRRPALAEMFKRAYIPLNVLLHELVVTTSTDHNPVAAAEEPQTDVSPAYPIVQPMKAALYFDSAEGFGEWRILISTRADGHLRQARRKNRTLFDIIIKKIKELSNGHFSDDNQKQLTGTETDVPIYEAKMTRDSRLVYQIDCVPEFESNIERQVIKLFGIYTHAKLDQRFWDGVGYQLGRKGKEYRKRCNFRNRPSKVGANAHVILPAEFPPPQEIIVESPSTGLPDLHKDDLERMHEMLVLEKYVTFSQAFLNSILADADVAHVFDVSPLEKDIIEHPYSCYVLGRSGTGKTTTMLFKMLGIERSYQLMQNETMHKPRQMFVTQSRVLAEKVKEFFLKLYESLLSADKSPEEIRAIIAARQAQQEQGLVDLDEEVDWRGDLPKRYGDLNDEHFPMFITYDQLCRLLEADLDYSLNSLPAKLSVQSVAEATSDHNGLSNDYMQQHRAAFVSYGTFLESYWPHFSQSLTKGLDPALVFAEFMGVLKGSEQTLAGTGTHLGKDQYFGLSHRTQGTFINQRETIYKLFQAYMKRKRERGDYDAADRTHAILKRLSGGVPGQMVDFIYIDEAQDNLLIDALVLRTICNNPDAGLFWAGDTAQTISIGSAFRFDDLKAFLYRIEECGDPRDKPRPQPRTFQLAVNYRSHAGIVNCAHSVIELITRFWPHAIDKLATERGIIEGLKPVFFSGWDEDTVRYEQFLFGASGSQIEFGAQQCILVRDDAARERLREQVGDIGLIMTLYESKGLEFNDVLLYNFFADSTVDLAQWRVVLNALSEGQNNKYKAPDFDDTRHNGVCRDVRQITL